MTKLKFTPDMKKMFIVPMFIALAMICSCQKKDSTAEQQLAQRKVELDAREEALAERKSALDEREKALDEREKSLAEKEKAAKNARTNPTDVQTADPARLQAERERLVRQLTTNLPDHSQLHAEKTEADRKIEEQRAQSQTGQEEKLRAIERKWQAAGTSSGAVFPAPAATLPIPSPAVEATSPSASPTPQ